ncbi:MMACHC [Acanthosepion pharaonis]|uniref:Cyanocobalamin reductase (cyanide-eliminating) n=1 Tax=Acanthosepion pharaonis TaxID=158019 RepID=A0A812B6U7_ACAPH|nr:MMACHC [Sepia pharaonis]
MNGILKDLGFEIYPMKVEWYNNVVEEKYHLPYDPDTVAIVVLSTPDMFDLAFKPFLQSGSYTGSNDGIDECIKYYMQKVNQVIPDIDIIYDYETIGDRQCRIIMQVAAHISGAAYYYQKKHITNDPWGEEKNIFGICIHPRYGGWFALRSVIILKNLQVPDLPYIEPVNCVPNEDRQIDLLTQLNENYKDWKFRDIISVKKKYSEEQKTYFATKPSDRKPLINKIINAGNKA